VAVIKPDRRLARVAIKTKILNKGSGKLGRGHGGLVFSYDIYCISSIILNFELSYWTCESKQSALTMAYMLILLISIYL